MFQTLTLDCSQMGYGTSAVRLDIGREARVRTAQYFGLGQMSPEDLVRSLSLFVTPDLQ